MKYLHALYALLLPLYAFSSVNGTLGSPQNDTTPPALLYFSQESATSLLLTFNEKIDPKDASFSLTGLGEVYEIYISEDYTQLRLVWLSAMNKGVEYQLSCSLLYDLSGNVLNGTIRRFVSAKGIEEKELPIILLNEIMANPKGVVGLPETEYVELRNTTDKDIPLYGWAFFYADKKVALRSVIPAKGYVVLFREGRSIKVDNGGVPIALANFPSALANTGKLLRLEDPSRRIIDSYEYPAATPGRSWERTPQGWQTSRDKRGGSPGSANSGTDEDTGGDSDKNTEPPNEKNTDVLPGEIIFNELLLNPFTDGSEYIELYNRSGRTLPLTGLAIARRNADNSLTTSCPLSSISRSLVAGGFALLTKKAEGITPFYLIASPDAIHEVNLPVLANTASKLVLFRTKDEVVIDEVSYSEKWHNPSLKDRKGVALERIDPESATQNAANWTSASAISGGGTPGYKNSQNTTNTENNPIGINTPEYSDFTGMYESPYQLDKAGYFCRAYIYDTSGRRLATVSNHQLTGVEGILSWDGQATGGGRIQSGLYIFYAELYHPQGDSKSYKEVFLVK